MLGDYILTYYKTFTLQIVNNTKPSYEVSENSILFTATGYCELLPLCKKEESPVRVCVCVSIWSLRIFPFN